VFVTDGASANRVICPHCRNINNLSGANTPSGTKPVRPNIVLQERPNYTINEASSFARQHLWENTSDQYNGWELVSVNCEGVTSCYSKSYCLDKEKNEVFCTKAVGRIRANSPQVIVDTYWNINQELIWNASTVQQINMIEDLGNEQLVYQQHKTTSAATMRNDVSYRRIKSPEPDGSIWVYSVSEQTSPETRANFRRGWVVFGGLFVEPGNDGFCQVSLVWCWDYNGWIHEKFVTEEKKRVALRLSKLGAQVAEYQQNPTNSTTRYINPAPNTSSSSSSYTPSSSTVAPPASKAPAKEGALRGCKDCRTPENGNYCSRCGNPTSMVCGRCYSTTLYSGTNCSNCGNKLRDPLPSDQ